MSCAKIQRRKLIQIQCRKLTRAHTERWWLVIWNLRPSSVLYFLSATHLFQPSCKNFSWFGLCFAREVASFLKDWKAKYVFGLLCCCAAWYLTGTCYLHVSPCSSKAYRQKASRPRAGVWVFITSKINELSLRVLIASKSSPFSPASAHTSLNGLILQDLIGLLARDLEDLFRVTVVTLYSVGKCVSQFRKIKMQSNLRRKVNEWRTFLRIYSFYIHNGWKKMCACLYMYVM